MRLLSEKPKWHLLYYVLGAIDIIAVCSSMYLNTVITEKYEQAVLTNEFWSKIRHEMRLLESSASKLNAPGNDVFDSRDIDKERARFREAAAGFENRFRAFRLLASGDERSNSQVILERIDEINGEAKEMNARTENIFSALRDGNVDKAASFMALLDQEFSELRDHTNELAVNFTNSQDLSLKEEQGRIKELRILDRSVSMFILVMVLGVILYGRQITSFVNKSTQALRDSKDKAESAAKTKASFLANMSHEIRTPLNGVVGNTTLLMETDLSKSQRDMVDTIKSSSDALLVLIDDILDFSKIEAGKLLIEQRPFDIRRSIADAVKVLSPRADEKAIPLRVEISERVPKIIVSDFIRFRQILLNLLSNAVKFTDKGDVLIYADASKGTGDNLNVTVSVRDSGIGMNREQQGRLFQDFAQVDASTTRRYGGTGLGLAICKHLCSLLGGKIWVESEEGKGSTFAFTITAKSGEGLEPVNVPRPVTSKGGLSMGADHPLRILVAEDNKVNQTLTTKFMNKFGYKVDLVENGSEAVKAASTIDYDVIFMDIHMPVLDGYEATKTIRDKRKDRPYIIALTSSVMQSDRQLCFDAGMDDFLKKPLEMPDLAAALQKVIAIRTNNWTSRSEQVRTEPNPDISLSEILKKFDNDFEIFRTVVGVYLGDYQNYVAGIERCFKSGDGKDLEEAAHLLKGAANNFSSTLVTAVAEQMEILGRENKVKEASMLFDQLAMESSQLAETLSEFISERSA